jgi:HAE1 family hydrophobic/amphiphilic exporter-1
VTDKANRTEPLERFEERVRATLSEVPQSTVNLSQPAIIDGLGDFPPIILILQGPDLDGLAKEGERLEAMLNAQADANDVRMSLSPGRPELAPHRRPRRRRRQGCARGPRRRHRPHDGRG